MKLFSHYKDNSCSHNSADVVGLYASMPHEVGLRALRETLDKRDEKTISTEELLKMAEFALKNNYFEFGNKRNNKSPELQLGLNTPYACSFMSVLETKFLEWNKQNFKLSYGYGILMIFFFCIFFLYH